MWFLRLLGNMLLGLLLGAFLVGVVAALQYPFSLFPLLGVLIACAIIMRVPPGIYWLFVIAIAVTDAYRATGFGVGLLSFAILVYCMLRVGTEFITHRSVIGCAVIAAGVGFLWPTLLTIIGIIFDWWRGSIISFQFADFMYATSIHTIATAALTTLVYVVVPRWWTARSPARVSGHVL